MTRNQYIDNRTKWNFTCETEFLKNNETGILELKKIQ